MTSDRRCPDFMHCHFVDWPQSSALSDSEIFKPYRNNTGRLLFGAVRLVFVVWGLAVMVWASSVQAADSSYWSEKLSGMTFFATIVYFAFAAYFAFEDPRNPPDRDISWTRKFVVYLFAGTFTFSLMVSVTYWVVLYSHAWSMEGHGVNYKVLTVHTHLLGLVWLMVDMLFNKLRFPHSLLFLILPTAFLFIIYNASLQSATTADGIDAHNEYSAYGWVIMMVSILVCFYVGHALTELNGQQRAQQSFHYTSASALDDTGMDDDDERFLDELYSDNMSGTVDYDLNYNKYAANASRVDPYEADEPAFEAVWRHTELPDRQGTPPDGSLYSASDHSDSDEFLDARHLKSTVTIDDF